MIMKERLLILIINLILYQSGIAFRGGAPTSECEGMTPNHSSPSTGSAPADVTFNPSCYKPGTLLNVTLKGSSAFAGLMLQFRKKGSNDIIDGTFENIDKNLYKLINCPPGTKNTITHLSKAKKTELKFTWTSKSTEDVELVYTYVQNFDTYWVKQVKAVKKC